MSTPYELLKSGFPSIPISAAESIRIHASDVIPHQASQTHALSSFAQSVMEDTGAHQSGARRIPATHYIPDILSRHTQACRHSSFTQTKLL